MNCVLRTLPRPVSMTISTSTTAAATATSARSRTKPLLPVRLNDQRVRDDDGIATSIQHTACSMQHALRVPLWHRMTPSSGCNGICAAISCTSTVTAVISVDAACACAAATAAASPLPEPLRESESPAASSPPSLIAPGLPGPARAAAPPALPLSPSVATSAVARLLRRKNSLESDPPVSFDCPLRLATDFGAFPVSLFGGSLFGAARILKAAMTALGFEKQTSCPFPENDAPLVRARKIIESVLCWLVLRGMVTKPRSPASSASNVSVFVRMQRECWVLVRDLWRRW